jgi:hypothetical protein
MGAELLGGVARPVDPPATGLHHAPDVRAVELVQALGVRRPGRAAADGPQRLLEAQRGAGRKDERALDDVLELPDIAGPRVGPQRGLAVDAPARPASVR